MKWMSIDSRQTWRLVLTPPTNGGMNMAIDEAILEAVGAGASPSTLRLYAWEPACLSLGFAQPYEQVDPGRLRERGWDLVRRPTGGRAILHTRELTYSVAAPNEDPQVAGGVLESYRHLSAGLVRALEILGLRPEVSPPVSLSEEQRRQPVCFDMPSSYEITVGGKKLLGSAQVRRVRSVLQHGSLPIFGDIGEVCQGLSYASAAERELAETRLRDRAATVEDLLGRRISWDQAAEAMSRAFVEALGLHLIQGKLSAEEEVRARELLSQRYGTEAWNRRI
jgi:lipoate-protein ligase A